MKKPKIDPPPIELVQNPKALITTAELNALTVKQLRKRVWALTKEVNVRAATMDSDASSEFISRLQATGGGKDKKVYANVNLATKGQLIYQAQNLQNFIRWDAESDVYKIELNELNEQRYQSFLENHELSESSMSREEWDFLVRSLKGLGNKLEQYGSENLIELYNKAKSQNKNIDLIKEASKTYKAHKEESLSVDDFIKLLYKEAGVSRS